MILNSLPSSELSFVSPKFLVDDPETVVYAYNTANELTTMTTNAEPDEAAAKSGTVPVFREKMVAKQQTVGQATAVGDNPETHRRGHET